MKAPETKHRIASGELGPVKRAQGNRSSNRPSASQGPRSGGIANPWAARINDAYKKTVEAVFDVGRLLIQAKDDLPHGEFQRMVARDLPFKGRWARMYMEVARSPFLSDRQYTAALPSSVETLALIGRLSKPEFLRRLEAREIHAGTTQKQAAAMAKGSATSASTPPRFPTTTRRERAAARRRDGSTGRWRAVDG